MRGLFRNAFYKELETGFQDHVELKRYGFTAIQPDAFMELENNKSKGNKPPLTNCKNCGAPLHGCTCEYCGTEY